MRFRGKQLRWGSGLCALACALAFGTAAAGAEDEPVAKPPTFNGSMVFPAIHGPDGPETFYWTVGMTEEQELVQIDERHAEVVYEGSGHRAFSIEAEQAHDATGTEVPTSFAVLEPDIVALTVHHRAGNPAKGGASFHYPVISGRPYETGFSTVRVEGPPPLAAPPASQSPPPCVVPKLAFRTLAGARERLATAGCRLGKVRGKRSPSARVVKQFRAAGTVHAPGARVAVKLG